MARGLNKVLLIGNLGADPEIKYTPSGTAIANLRLATAESRKNSEGEWEDHTEWHRVVMFGRRAETCKDYLKKGSKIYIEGRIQTRSWDDQSGQKRYMTEVLGYQMIMLDPKGQGPSADTQDQVDTAAPQSDSIPEPPPDDLPQADSDLPF